MSRAIAAACIVAFLVGCIASFLMGTKLTRDAFSAELMATQAMLSFNHLQRYEEISKCLESNLVEAASEKARISAIGERDNISAILKSINVQWLNEYIELRSEESLESFKDFQSPLGQGWTVAAC